jgi:tRNA/rRNA methyltransferase
VQLLCYELRISLGAVSQNLTFAAAGTPATYEEIEGPMAHLESEAVASGFLDPENPRRLMLRLRRLFARAGLEKEEVNILRGLLASFRQPTGKQHRPG